MLTHVEKEMARSGTLESKASFGWSQDGKIFVVRSKEQMCATWLTLFFGQAKFSSFTRKLYRWGFRKINMTPRHEVGYSEHVHFFGNENFQRDTKGLLSQMKSVTAVKTRGRVDREATKQAWLPYIATSCDPGAQHDSQAMKEETNHGYPGAPGNVCANHIISLPVETEPATVGQTVNTPHAVSLAALQSLLAEPRVDFSGHQWPPIPSQYGCS